MKKLFVFLIAILTILTAAAQEDLPIVLEQETFSKVNADALTGVNIDPIAKDLSRNACARVKIKFAGMSRAEVDALDIKFQSNTHLARRVVAQYFDNVLILEMTAKPMTRFYVKHPTLGESNEVRVNLEGDCEYEMMAHLNQRFSIVVESNVAGADVLIDGVKKAVTDSNCKATIDDVMVGSHNLKLSYNGITAEQTIEVKKGSISFHLDVDQSALEPQYVVFSVTPENAVVIVDNQHHTLTEGVVMLVRPRGTYNYTITAAGYHSQSGTFTVAGEKVEKFITLKADAANVTLTVADGAEIWVNGALKGTSRWSGMLSSGTYIFEARKAGYKSTKLSKTITSASANQSYALPAPTPIVGKLAISSTPLMADVTLDGKLVGRTPIDIPNLLVGNHTLKISKAGYADNTQTITISEGKTTMVNPTLTKQQTSASASASGTYNIGDLVTINGAQGIVFQTSPVVKIVSVKEGSTKWSEYGVTNATDKDNGKANMDKIKAISGWQTNYPPFKWCADYGNGWYLPAINELKAIYVQRDKIDKTLSANNMDKLGSKDSWLWSSSEYDSIGAYYVNFSIGTYGHLSKKGNNFAVRAVYVVPSSSNATSAPAQTPKPSAPSSTTTTPKTYNIGDLVTVEGVQGIVFQTSPVVKIVSVEEGFTKWGEFGVTTNAYDKYNGKANMEKIKAISGWQTKYPAFKWCADYGTGWYLPSYNELKTIYAQKDVINKTLSTNNKKQLGSKDSASWLWSSSEYGSHTVYDIKFSDGSYRYGHDKQNDMAVRAVLALE